VVELIRSAGTRVARLQGPVLLVLGSAWDFATLRRVDRWTDHVLLVSYLAALAVLVVVQQRLERGRSVPRFAERRSRWVYLGTQFLFGGLLSAYVVYYTRSATLGRSLVFLAVLVGLLVVNELAEAFLRRGVVPFLMLFLCVFCMLLVLLPVWSGLLVGFVPAGLGALLFVLGVVVLSGWPLDPAGPWRDLARAAGPPLTACTALLAVCVGLLELGLVPPVPLALAEAGMFHEVRREPDGYHLVHEDQGPWSWHDQDAVFHWQPGQPVWCFSAVFAPTGMTLEVVHRWQQRTPEGWIDRNRIEFEVHGGRDGGFRGYTRKEHVEPGAWRVIVETPRGVEIGRVRFDIVEGPVVREMVERVY
jgi:hypothetical protein